MKQLESAIVQHLRESLETTRLELQRRIRQREVIEVVRYADPIDESLQLSQREICAGEIDHDTTLLHSVVDALKSMEDGSYGICQDCDEPIPVRRLEAVPWVDTCCGCQQRREEAAKDEQVTA